MMNLESPIVTYLAYGLAALLFGLVATRLFMRINRTHIKAFDKPNSRGLHTTETPVGGGLPLLAVVVLLWLTMWPLRPVAIAVIVGVIVLATISWIDDLKPVRQILRFLAQLTVITAVLYQFDGDARVFSHSWPLLADRLATIFCWIWFINLFNFMDGIDGLAGAETIAICAGLVSIGIFAGFSLEPIVMALTISGAILGFLYWNWHPAKLFLGDVGSIPLGFLLGWLLIQLATSGYLAAAFILPLYFLGDATTTMVMRLFRGEAIWEPHRQHFYQGAVLAGWSHANVVLRISFANLILIGLAIYSIQAPIVACALALLVVFLLFYLLKNMAATGRNIT